MADVIETQPKIINRILGQFSGLSAKDRILVYLNPDLYKCPHCMTASYPRRDRLKDHMREKHPEKLESFQSLIQEKIRQAEQKMQLQYPHMFDKQNRFIRKQPVKKRKIDSKGKYECPICSKNFTYKNYTEHVLTHGNENLFICSYCPPNSSYLYNGSQNLNNHVNEQHSDKHEVHLVQLAINKVKARGALFEKYPKLSCDDLMPSKKLKLESIQSQERTNIEDFLNKTENSLHKRAWKDFRSRSGIDKIIS